MDPETRDYIRTAFFQWMRCFPHGLSMSLAVGCIMQKMDCQVSIDHIYQVIYDLESLPDCPYTFELDLDSETHITIRPEFLCEHPQCLIDRTHSR